MACTGAVLTEAGCVAQVKAPSAGRNSMWRRAPPMA